MSLWRFDVVAADSRTIPPEVDRIMGQIRGYAVVIHVHLGYYPCIPTE